MQNVATTKIGTKMSLGGPSGPSFFFVNKFSKRPHLPFVKVLLHSLYYKT